MTTKEAETSPEEMVEAEGSCETSEEARLKEELERLKKELERERQRKALWADIAVAIREAGCSMVPALWHSQATERVRELMRDEEKFEAEIDDRMKSDEAVASLRSASLLVESTSPASDDKSTA
jgi:hypothetical protein